MDLTNNWKLVFDFILKLTFRFKAPHLFISFQFSYKVGSQFSIPLPYTTFFNKPWVLFLLLILHTQIHKSLNRTKYTHTCLFFFYGN